MKKVITYGTFDLLHVGHINFLKRARKLGDHLIVVISFDDFNLTKGKSSVYYLNDRIEILESTSFIDEVMIETSWEQKIDDIIDNQIDIFVIDKDWEGKFDFLNNYCEVIYLDRTPEISTSLIKKELKKYDR